MAGRSRKKVADPIGQVDDLDAMNVPGNSELETGESVTVRMDANGHGQFWPSTFDRLPAEKRELIGHLMMLVGQRRALAREIDTLVAHMRGEHRFSWGQIGWCLGMSPEGARQRWADAQNPLPRKGKAS